MTRMTQELREILRTEGCDTAMSRYTTSELVEMIDERDKLLEMVVANSVRTQPDAVIEMPREDFEKIVSILPEEIVENLRKGF